MPWLYLKLAWAICLLCSILGFKRVVYFVSLSYALSIGAQAVVFGTLFSSSVTGWPMVELCLVFAYGLRLGSFLLIRARGAGFRQELNDAFARGQRVKAPVKPAIWIGVSVLYALLFLPVLLTLSAQARSASTWSAPIGVAMMAVGLLLEAAADWQKSQFKLIHPDRFCDVALYRMVRCPNYLGEIIFWLGVWLSAVAAYQTRPAWILSTLGFMYLAGVMLGATRRLEAKQLRRYGSDPAYRKWATTVPVLVPLIPLYSLRSKRLTAP